MTSHRLLDPKNDFCFKQTFGTEKNQDILIPFLNDVLLQPGKEPITEVSFLKTHQNPDIAAHRQSIVDVLCKDKKGSQFIVEMQVSHHKGFEKRAQYYAAKAYSMQILTEDKHHKKLAVYAKLKEVVFLAIADFIMFPDKVDWKSEHRLLDDKTYEHDLKDFHFVFIELPKFKKSLEQVSNMQEKWAYFFRYGHESSLTEIEQLAGNDLAIKRAFQAIDQASWTEKELNTYEQMVKTQLDNLAVEQQKIEDAEARGKKEGEQIGLEKGEQIGLEKGEQIGLEKGEQIGLEKGEQIGLEKGEQIGLEKGEQIGLEKIVKELIRDGMALDKIVTLTNLSKEHVQKLSEKIARERKT